ncbi:MAG: hypothetical protein ACI9DJ_002612 [Algoriphagus sp.]|jgi:hypothetical protein
MYSSVRRIGSPGFAATVVGLGICGVKVLRTSTLFFDLRGENYPKLSIGLPRVTSLVLMYEPVQSGLLFFDLSCLFIKELNSPPSII